MLYTQLLMTLPSSYPFAIHGRSCSIPKKYSYPDLCVKTSFVTGTGQKLCVIEPGLIASALGRAKLATLPTFHALSGADIIGSEVFLVNENVHAGKAFRDADEDTLGSL